MRFAIATLGCKVNQYDSAMIESRLGALGMERGEFDEPADVYVVNTCTVTDRADTRKSAAGAACAPAESRRPRDHDRMPRAGESRDSRGCGMKLMRSSGLGRPGDLERAVIGVATRARDGLEPAQGTRRRSSSAPVALEGHTRAFLKLQEGCDQFCTFCIVPFSRGLSRSVDPRRVIDAIDGLHERGFKEVILTGVHLGGYGKDLDPPIALEALLEMIAERSPIGRVRISSLDPEELSDRDHRDRRAERQILPAFPSAAAGGRRRDPRADAPALHHRALSRARRADSRGDARCRDRHRRDRRVSGRDRAAVRAIALSLSRACRWPICMCFPTRCAAAPRRRNSATRLRRGEIKRRAAAMRELGERKRRICAAQLGNET